MIIGIGTTILCSRKVFNITLWSKMSFIIPHLKQTFCCFYLLKVAVDFILYKQFFSFFEGHFSDMNPSTKAISILLKRFIQALVPCCKSLLKQGYEKVLRRSVSYTTMSGFLLLSVPGVILREFLVLLTMAQNFAPSVASTSEGVPLLGELLDSLDMFNHSNKNWQSEDMEDLSWLPEGKLMFVIHFGNMDFGNKIDQ